MINYFIFYKKSGNGPVCDCLALNVRLNDVVKIVHIILLGLKNTLFLQLIVMLKLVEMLGNIFFNQIFL